MTGGGRHFEPWLWNQGVGHNKLKSLDFCKILLYGGRIGEQKLVEEGEFKILPLFYLEIELAFQITNITMVSFEFLYLILYSNSYVSFAWMFMLQFLFMKFCLVKHVYCGHPI